MPHEVIMPALGMAQETGIIVTWLKQPGDAVAEGEVLMEVETDKATMEVEAQASGFLAEVSASEGESVPVGSRVAIIADSPDAIGTVPDSVPAPAPEAGPCAAVPDAPKDAPDDALPEGHDVIMPALGMAQETGRVVAWHAALGAKIAAGDALLEVETDKATMEVEAERSGFLGAILAEAGDDVPVGQRIAILTETAPDKPVRRALMQEPAGSENPNPAKDCALAAHGPRSPERTLLSERILASPKARRLASETGLDLADLVAAGYPQPFHVADLEALRGLPNSARKTVAPGSQPNTFEAEVPSGAFDAFQEWLATEHAEAPSGPRILAAFAAGALRTALKDEGPIVVAAGAEGAFEAMADPDLRSLATKPESVGGSPALLLRDLTATAITAQTSGNVTVPTLTFTRREDRIALHLSYCANALLDDAALALVAGVASRLEQPLRHLL